MNYKHHVKRLRVLSERRKAFEEANPFVMEARKMGFYDDDRVSFRTCGEIERYMAENTPPEIIAKGPSDEEFCQEFATGWISE